MRTLFWRDLVFVRPLWQHSRSATDLYVGFPISLSDWFYLSHRGALSIFHTFSFWTVLAAYLEMWFALVPRVMYGGFDSERKFARKTCPARLKIQRILLFIVVL